jgi:hypothetical protein
MDKSSASHRENKKSHRHSTKENLGLSTKQDHLSHSKRQQKNSSRGRSSDDHMKSKGPLDELGRPIPKK